MEVDRNDVAGSSDPGSEPALDILNRAQQRGRRLGVFASSFNPPTVAHIELIRRASKTFSLDESLALASPRNADKIDYECSLEDRLAMLRLGLADDGSVSIGLSTHPFYVDMVEAIERAYPLETDLHFIVGFDTFERVVDSENRYTARYHRHYRDRIEALNYLFDRSKFIVAGRAGAGLDNLRSLFEREPCLPADRVAFLDFPPDLGEISATEARNRLRSGAAITGLVPPRVERYIFEHRLYTR